METEETRTLPEINASLSSESEPFGSSVQAQQNGVRVSSIGDKISAQTETEIIVQAEILVQKSFVRSNGSGVWEDGVFLGDGKVTGVSSSSEYEREDKADHGGGSEAAKGSLEGDSTLLDGDGFDEKIGMGENGISVVAEAHGSLDMERNGGYVDERDFTGENGGDPSEKFVEIPGLEGMGKHEANHDGQESEDDGEEGEKNCGYGEGEGKGSVGENGGDPGEKFMKSSGLDGMAEHEGNQNGVENEDDRKEDEGEKLVRRSRKRGGTHIGEENEDDGEEDEGEEGEDGEEDEGEEGEDGEEDEGEQEHEYLVGDFVWGKIRSHPWWPGQVYDASDASEYARKYNRKERRLVAYFGDGSFSWCSPSQLKPFAEKFEEMSKQSSSKSFVNAVHKALDEIGRLVEMKMASSCIPEGNRIGFDGPLAINVGIKQGVLVPGCDLSRLSIPQPAELLLNLRYIAEAICVSNMLELTVLRSWLSTYYRANGGHKLAMYHEPIYIEGLEDKNSNVVTEMINDFSGPVEVPFEEDWLSSPVHPGLGQTNQPSLKKCPVISEDKLYHRRKKKSVADLLKENTVVEPKKKKSSVVKDITCPGKLVSTSGKKKRKSSDEAPSQAGGDLTPSSGKKSYETLGSAKSAPNKVSRAENGLGEAEKETKKKENVSSAKEETVSREKKKSKYLSPPFISPKGKRARNLQGEKDVESKSVKISKVAQFGERMSKVAIHLQRNSPKKLDTEVETSAVSSPNPSRDQGKIIDTAKINASTEEVISELWSAALNPLHLRQKKSVDMFSEFISVFRSSIFFNGSNYKIYHRRHPGRKRKLISSDREMPASKSQQKADEKGEDEASMHVSLEVAFPPGLSLPSKNDLITIFSQFGDLNDAETEVLYNSQCARVVFMNSCDAEEAFKECVKKSPYGDADVKYRLRHSPAASKGGEENHQGLSTLKISVEAAASQPSAAEEVSPILFAVKEKLEMMTSMLENSDGNMTTEMKSKLEVEMKGLLEEVSKVAK